MSRTRTLLTATVVAALVPAMTLTGCSSAPRALRPQPVPVAGSPEPSLPAIHRVSHGAVLPPRLTRFDDCSGFLSAVKQEAQREVGPYGLPGPDGVPPMPAPGVMTDAVGSTTSGVAGSGSAGSGSAGSTTAAAAPAGAGGGFSGTNDQEAGVDEPDLSKTDGHLLVLVRHEPLGLEVMAVGDGSPRRLGFLALDRLSWDTQLLLTGSLVVAIGSSMTGAENGQPVTLATVVSVADPAHPRVVRTFRVPGQNVAARLLAGRVVLVAQRSPVLRWQMPQSQSRRGVASATAFNRRVVASSRLADWLPAVTTTPSHRTFAPACDAAWHGSTPQGVGTVTVVSFDPAREDSVGQTTVLGNAGTVYASTTGLYLATSDWRPGPVAVFGMAPDAVGGMPVRGPMGPPATTRIHAFDLHDPAAPHYLGTGTVAGQIVDQYSLSEYHGDLRVATTVGTAIPAPGEGSAPTVLSDSRVTVLRPVDGALVQVGQVRGLGRGERLYGVRFLGDVGYVVTFRSIDPLYVLDLADPRHPREVAHLMLTGYSAYLHPLGDGLLFGLGHKVDRMGAPTGEQLSVFDVSSPARPALRSRVYLDGANSTAENDHHAFLWWAKDRLVVLPVDGPNGGYDGQPGADVVVYHVDGDGQLHRMGAVQQPATSQGYYEPERSLVIGGVLYVVSDQGVLASDLHSLKRVAWVPFR